MNKSFQTIDIPKLPVLTTEEGINQIRNNLKKIDDWKNLIELIPNFYISNKMKRTGIAGMLAASLELTKDGTIQITQDKLFEKIMIRNKN